MELRSKKQSFVRKPLGKRNDLRYTTIAVKLKGKSPLLWGCLKSNVSRQFVKLDGSLNNVKYIQLMKDNLISDLDKGEIL